ncbi:ribosomal protein L28e [Coniophora puteana RWD-64-598 SS2]|uniref:Ribosomal protein L28e n=1 Tax=Coniophora puteana (strain RWD-64-598) TaxID=741705 RepID=A0A5M3N799_CONPW|nr:ribosomal protein L28e [Coniophora puteana RWD-64-598 SS2]EIW87322.1 ribosomal protein L28e [Coniophora puteana RWD-64-598 SS2]
MSSDLQWYLIRNYNSYLVKKVPEGPIFSREPGNLRNLHSYKYSGLANKKAIDISDSGNGIKITTKKTKSSPQAVRGSLTSTTIRNRSGGRRALGAAAQLTKRGYRGDLRAAALGRTSALVEAQKEKKNPPQKKVRGKYRAGAADSSA